MEHRSGRHARHLLHRELHREGHLLARRAKPEAPGRSDEHSGITDFGQTFPRRIHAFLEDVTNGVPQEDLRASGRDALAALEYTWAVIESYERAAQLVRPHPLPPLHGDPATLLE